MRWYMRKRRHETPELALWERARARATSRGVPFDLKKVDILIPVCCPALGISLITGHERSPNSPSLDRITPAVGYVRGNIRVISDKANRLKGDRSIDDLRALAALGPENNRSDHARIVEYLEREELLNAVRSKGRMEGSDAIEWFKIGQSLDVLFGRFGSRIA